MEVISTPFLMKKFNEKIGSTKWRLSKISELYNCRIQSRFELFTNCQAK